MTNDLDDQLSRTLREHAGDAGTPRLDLDAVRGRARRIRRTRTALVGAGAAAVVLAVVAPLGLLGGGSSDRSVDPATRGTASVDDSVVRGERVVIDLDDLEVGEPARVPYELDGVLHLPSGATRDLLPEQPGTPVVGDVVPYGEGDWLVTVAPEGSGVYELQRLGADGELLETIAGAADGLTVNGNLAYDPATARVAWVEQSIAPVGELPDSVEVVTANDLGQEIARNPLPVGVESAPFAWPLGFRGADVVVALGGSVSVRTLLVAADDSISELAPEQTDAVSPDGELAVRTTYGPDGSCATVRRVDDGVALGWSEDGCRSYGGFDPESRYVLAGPAEEQVAFNGQVESVLDAATGASVVELLLPPGAQTSVWAGVWESPRTLLVSVRQSASETAPARYGLVRIDVTTGRADLAAPIAEYDATFETGGERFFVR